MHGMSIIFCQNLLIYFRKYGVKEILESCGTFGTRWVDAILVWVK